MEDTVVDGVHRLPPSGISILIVGGGIGGLTMACEGWRQGHDVQVLEKSPSLLTIGDFVSIQPSAFATLRLFPRLHEDVDSHAIDAIYAFHTHSGQRLFVSGEAPWNRPGETHCALNVHVTWLQSRIRIYEALEAQVRRLGIPILYGKNVVEYDEDEERGIVRTDAGQVYRADIVVAADGVGNKSHEFVTGSLARARGSGYAIYRGTIPAEGLRNVGQDARERYLSGTRPEIRVHIGGGSIFIIMVVTPETVWYQFYHPDHGNADESWRGTVSTAEVLKVLDEAPGWDPAIREIIAQTPDHSIVDWLLRWRNPQPEWSSKTGRVVQLGDSAHSFLPLSGSGATQAMEDALSLATCLRLGGKDNMTTSVKAHVRIRFTRTSILQRFGFSNHRTLTTTPLEGTRPSADLAKVNLPRWTWYHDPVAYAEEKYRTAMESILTGAKYEDTNIPPGFVYVPWTIEEELESEQKGLQSRLWQTGDWS